MDTKDQLILALSQNNIRLSDEIAALKAELAKYQQTNKVEEVVKAKTVRKKKVVDPDAPEKVKNPVRIETGKKLALWNANRKCMKQAFSVWKENIAA